MNRDDVTRMAREAGFAPPDSTFITWGASDEQLERFFQAAYDAGADAEREACAKVCEKDGLLWGQRYADAIRARIKK